MSSKPTYLVTGGAGFVGSHLVRELLLLGINVNVIDDLSTGEQSQLPQQVTFFKGSITNPDLVHKAMTGCSVVIHLAALARVPLSIEEPATTDQVNVHGTVVLLDHARRLGINRFINTSSSSVYGLQDTFVMQEKMVPHPQHPYGLQKYIAEQYCSLFAELYSMSILSLRLFNVYGPNMNEKAAYRLLFPIFATQKKAGKPLTIFGDGSQRRTFTYITDVVSAYIKAANYQEKNKGYHHIFNIAGPEEISVKQVAEAFNHPIEYIVPNPRGDLEEMRKQADLTKARSLLGWKPNVEFKTGMSEYLQSL